MDLYGRYGAGLGRKVQLRILQSDADLHTDRSDRDGFIQAENMVLLLPDGNDDAGNLQDQEQRRKGIEMQILLFDKNCHIFILTKKEAFFQKYKCHAINCINTRANTSCPVTDG